MPAWVGDGALADRHLEEALKVDPTYTFASQLRAVQADSWVSHRVGCSAMCHPSGLESLPAKCSVPGPEVGPQQRVEQHVLVAAIVEERAPYRSFEHEAALLCNAA